MAVTVITLLALIVAFIFTLQQMSTLPAQPLQLYVSKQWVTYVNTGGLSAVTYPIALSDIPFIAITTEADPAGWDDNINGIAVAGADLKTASNSHMNVLSKWIVNGGTVKQDGQAVRLIIIGC